MSSHSVPTGATSFAETRLFAALARAGYATRGVIYALIGLLALRIAEGVGSARIGGPM